MVTLHAYILREQLKLFGLTIIGLVGLITMGGGVYNVFRGQGISATDLFAVLPLLIPILLTVLLPVAAMFAATLVYGRFAADNELLAARAAGINVHWLMLSAILLATFVALCVLLLSNHVIPGLAKRLDLIVRQSISDFARQQLQQRGYLRYGPSEKTQFYMTAEEVRGVEPAALRERNFPTGDGYAYLLVHTPTVLQLEAGRVARFVVSEWMLCQFDSTRDDIGISIWSGPAREYEVGRRAVQIEQGERILTYRVRRGIPARLSWQDLPTLMLWRSQPWRAERLREPTESFLFSMQKSFLAEELQANIAAGAPLTFVDQGGQRYALSAETAQLNERGEPRMRNVRVEQFRPGQEMPVRFEAPVAELRPQQFGDAMITELRLTNLDADMVREYAPVSGRYGSPRESLSLSLDGLQTPERVQQRSAQVSLAQLFDEREELPFAAELNDHRAALLASAHEFRLKVDALIHFRLAFAVEALVTVLLGAILGVIFRGARPLAAFLLAVAPFLSITLMMLMGQRLAENPGTDAIGPFVIWGGLGAVALLDAVLLYVGVRR